MSEAKEIVWNLINSALAGGLVISGSFLDGDITKKSVFVGCMIGVGVMLTQFKEYWSTQKREYTGLVLFRFI